MSENKILREKKNTNSLKEELYKIKTDLDFIYNEICNPNNGKNKKVCSYLYCYLIHQVRKKGKEMAKRIIPEKYEEFDDYVLFPLKMAKKLCSYDCQQSRFYFNIAMKNLSIYIKTSY